MNISIECQSEKQVKFLDYIIYTGILNCKSDIAFDFLGENWDGKINVNYKIINKNNEVIQ